MNPRSVTIRTKSTLGKSSLLHQSLKGRSLSKQTDFVLVVFRTFTKAKTAQVFRHEFEARYHHLNLDESMAVMISADQTSQGFH